ncbi:protein phosphatase 1 regulatory subunit 3A-like [Alosa pseudoharengus]|uniref:protein phosphatase 1 regulatory subunit 3A-like n=1 Tax=Alosa pseudoharengus TaxID=34774 RepID=UPI003F8B2726
MESGGAQGPKAGSCCLLAPGPCFLDEEEDVEINGIRPKCSPLPKRRSSESLDVCQPPPSSTRRVSFADAFGLSLVSVKQFSGWDVTDCSGDFLVGNTEDRDSYLLSSPFPTPLSREELLKRVEEQKLELESLTLLPGTTTLRGVVRVLNICYSKTVYVRMSLDLWKSHFDLLAEYVPGFTEERTDFFSFKHTLVPQSSSDGTRLDFCLRYETELGTFWANNDGNNYVVFCHKYTEVPEQKDIGIKENKLLKKSCLKAPR